MGQRLMLGKEEMKLVQIENTIKELDHKICRGQVDKNGKETEKAREVERECLVKEIDQIRNEMEKLSKDELEDHKLIKLKNERMYQLE